MTINIQLQVLKVRYHYYFNNDNKIKQNFKKVCIFKELITWFIVFMPGDNSITKKEYILMKNIAKKIFACYVLMVAIANSLLHLKLLLLVVVENMTLCS